MDTKQTRLPKTMNLSSWKKKPILRATWDSGLGLKQYRKQENYEKKHFIFADCSDIELLWDNHKISGNVICH